MISFSVLKLAISYNVCDFCSVPFFVLVCTFHWTENSLHAMAQCVPTHSLTGRHTHIHTDRQTYRQRHTYRQYTPYQPNQPLPSQPKPNYTQLTNHTHLGVAAPQKMHQIEKLWLVWLVWFGLVGLMLGGFDVWLV